MELNELEISNIKDLLNSSDIVNHKLAIELAIGYGKMTYNHLAEIIINEWVTPVKYDGNAVSWNEYILDDYRLTYRVGDNDPFYIDVYYKGKYLFSSDIVTKDILPFNLVKLITTTIKRIYESE